MIRKASCIVTVLLFSASLFSLVLTVLPANVSATTLYVGGVGPGNYTTIQGAINASFPGDTIFVYKGNYDERIIIDESLSLVGENRNTTIIDGRGSGFVVGVRADWVNVTGFTVTNSDPLDGGIVLSSVQNCYVADNNISGNGMSGGVYLSRSEYNIIANNVVTLNDGGGVKLRLSNYNIIVQNTVSSNDHSGLKLIDSEGNMIGNNLVSSNQGAGIYLEESNESFIENNTIVGNGWHGIYVHKSHNITVNDNDFSSNYSSDINLSGSGYSTVTRNAMTKNGILLIGYKINYDTHTIDTTNTVNGKPVYYWKNISGGTVPSGAGQVILANCTDVVVEGQNVSDTSVGIQLGYSSRNLITNNTAYSNIGTGIYLLYSNDNEIVGNIILNNDNGIVLSESGSNTIHNNTVSSNMNNGIWVRFSDGNNITHNNISMNTDTGIVLDYSDDNRVYHNNITDNVIQAFANTDTNQWDNGYPSGGNYWSDYTGADEKSGPNQDLLGGDGIGDDPYHIPEVASRDRYPLMFPMGSTSASPLNNPPTCTIVSPAPGETLSITYTITGTASDPDGTVQMVEIRIDDGVWTQAIGDVSWSYEWNTTNVSNGEHKIYARSYDGENYSTEVNVTLIVDNPGPPTDQEPQDDWLWIALMLIAVIVVVVLLIVFMLVRRRKKSSEVEEPPEPPPEEQL